MFFTWMLVIPFSTVQMVTLSILCLLRLVVVLSRGWKYLISRFDFLDAIPSVKSMGFYPPSESWDLPHHNARNIYDVEGARIWLLVGAAVWKSPSGLRCVTVCFIKPDRICN
jgi:hypothetical protein